MKSVVMFLNGLDALAQAGIICFLGIVIVISNTLIIATLLNYKGKYIYVAMQEDQNRKIFIIIPRACKFNPSNPLSLVHWLTLFHPFSLTRSFSV